MSSNWHDSARALFAKSPELAGRILHDLLKADLPPVIEYTLLTPLCGDEPYRDEGRLDDNRDDLHGERESAGDRFDDAFSAPIPEMVILAGPASGDQTRMPSPWSMASGSSSYSASRASRE